MTGRLTSTPDPAELERLAREALGRLPEPFARHLGDVVLRIEEFADRSTLRSLGLSNPWELTGLYQGRPLSEASIWSSGEMPPIITLFRSPLLSEWRETGVRLEDLVLHVVVHEVGHHFGLSDDDMDALES
jgi:predicted Zn-dependent protease with MMP-like domain